MTPSTYYNFEMVSSHKWRIGAIEMQTPKLYIADYFKTFALNCGIKFSARGSQEYSIVLQRDKV